MQKFRPMRAVVKSRFVNFQVRNENINSVSKADNDGVPCGTPIGWSELRVGTAENGAGTKTVRIFPGTNRFGGVRHFAAPCGVDQSGRGSGASRLAVA